MPDLHDNGPFCCGKASWWAEPKRMFVCSQCGKEFPEKLTACKECKHEGRHWCCNEHVRTRRFNAKEGNYDFVTPLCSDVNTDGHCDQFKAKDAS